MYDEYDVLEDVMKNFAYIALLSLLFGCGSKEDTGEGEELGVEGQRQGKEK